MWRNLHVLFWMITIVAAQERPRLEFSFLVSDENTRGILLRCGIDSAATEGLDPLLGEYPMPGHPPDGFHAAWEIVTDGITDLSYTDFRPYPESVASHFAVDYSLNLSPKFTGRGDLLIFQWTYPLPRGIDSVIITDRLGGQLVTLRLGAKGADTISGSYVQLERFIVRVFYSPASVLSIEEQHDTPCLIVGQSPFTVSVPLPPITAMVYSLGGERIEGSYTYADGVMTYHIKGVSCGWYLLLIYLQGGRQRVIPLLVH